MAERSSNRNADGSKRRWSTTDRAKRAAAPRGARGDRSAAPRDGAGRDDRRTEWFPGGRTAGQGGARGGRPGAARGRDDRAPRDDRQGGADRFRRDDRAPRDGRAGGFDRPRRDGRAPRDDRQGGADRFRRDDRAARDDRQGGSDRFRRDDRPSYDDRSGGSYRPRRDDRAPRDARSGGGDRFRRDDRTPREDRFRRDDRAAGDRRPDVDPRPFSQREERPGARRATPQRGGGAFERDRDRDRRAAFTPGDDVVLDRLEAQVVSADEVEGRTFADLGLGGNIVRSLADLGAEQPFPIQAATIPVALAGRDVLGRGRTGSGKTIAFGAPLVERLLNLWHSSGAAKEQRKRSVGRAPRALILAPTRELAYQIDRTVQPIARSVGLFTTQVVGGVPQARQVGALLRGVDIVIGTPGRIEDLVEQGRLDLSQVVVTVLDEADHMCDLGFLEPVQRILRRTAPGGQRLLFSATLDSGVAKLVDEFLDDPSVHEVAGESQETSTIEHRLLVIDHREKAAVIEQLSAGDGRTLVFARTRSYAEQLADQLEDAGIRATSLHGDLNQSRRSRNLGLLTSGKVNVLVATDVAARGIHVDDISLVIQADAPDDYKTYLHRAGRTGRAGREGTVVTLVSANRRRRVDELLSRAEIDAQETQVRAGDAFLDELAAR